MNVAEEITIYEAIGVRVTSLRVMVGNKMHSISDITSVQLGQRRRGGIAALFALAGVLIGSCMVLPLVADLLLAVSDHQPVVGAGLNGFQEYIAIASVSVAGMGLVVFSIFILSQIIYSVEVK